MVCAQNPINASCIVEELVNRDRCLKALTLEYHEIQNDGVKDESSPTGAYTETVGLTLHRFDFVVKAFHGTCGNAVMVKSEDAVAVFLPDSKEAKHHANYALMANLDR